MWPRFTAVDLSPAFRLDRCNARMGTRSGLLVGTVAGLFEAHSSGASWAAQATSLTSKGAVRGLVVDARDPEVLYAATSKAGFQRSEDGGRTWCELQPANDSPANQRCLR